MYSINNNMMRRYEVRACMRLCEIRRLYVQAPDLILIIT